MASKAAKIQGISASGLSAMVADKKSKAVVKKALRIKYLLDAENPFKKNTDLKRMSGRRWPG